MFELALELTWYICTPLIEIAKNTLLHMDSEHPWVCFGCDLFNRNRYRWDFCTTPASWRNIVWAQVLDIPLWPLCRVHNVCFTLCSLILYACSKHVTWVMSQTTIRQYLQYGIPQNLEGIFVDFIQSQKCTIFFQTFLWLKQIK